MDDSLSSSLDLVWNLNFYGNLNDWEIGELSSILSIFDIASLNRVTEGARVWKFESLGGLSCKSFSNWVINDLSRPQILLASIIWKAKVP